jgi:hypothetical protein
MAGVRLALRSLTSSPGSPYYRPEDRSGTVHYIPHLRLQIRLSVMPRDAIEAYRPKTLPADWSFRAILDTGAPLTLFPFPIWQPFRDVIRWLDQPPVTTVRHVTILGGSFTYRLGRVRFGVFDEDANWLPAAWTNALFLDVRIRLFDQRQIRCADSPGEPLGQVWWLEDTATAAVSR